MTESFIRWSMILSVDVWHVSRRFQCFTSAGSIRTSIHVENSERHGHRSAAHHYHVIISWLRYFCDVQNLSSKRKTFSKNPKPLLTNEANMKAATSCDTEPCEESEILCSTFSIAIHKCTIWVAVMVVVGLAATRPDRTGTGGVSDWFMLPCHARCTTSK